MRTRTICFLSLLVLAIGAAAASVAFGARSAGLNAPGTCTNPAVTCRLGASDDGSQWKIEVPSNWNGTLLLYSHGYVPPPGPNPPPDDAGSRDVADYLLAHGFALAGSSYASFGWAVGDAFDDQEAVLDEFRHDFGKPKATIAWGHSMGGMITAGLLQLHPNQFVGGLAMCGLLGGGIGLWNTNLDLEVAFKALMMLDPNPAVSGPASTLQVTHVQNANANIGAAEAALAGAQSTPEGRARIALAAAMIDLPSWFSLASPEPGPTDYTSWEQNQFQAMQIQMAFVFGFRQELETRAGGNPTWNTGIDYAAQLQKSADRDEVQALYQTAGLDLDADLSAINATQRISPDAAAARYMEKNVVYTGLLHEPLLTMHTTSDFLVPFQHEQAFAEAVAGAKRTALLRQLFVHRPGHCAFTGAETLTALNVLLDRLNSGDWHQAGDPAALNAQATALGPALNTISPAPGVPAVPAPSSFVATEPSEFLRPFILPPGGHSRLP
jgi:pimeloyl-ACP methyl ester carboxylesterase